jgi:hypothetical protein
MYGAGPCFLLALCIVRPLIEGPSSPVLYYIEDKSSADGRGIDIRDLVGLFVDRDNKLQRETYLSAEQSYFGHFGGHFLVQEKRTTRDRITQQKFIVTKYGGVIDLQTRKVINDQKNGYLLGIEGGKVTYRIMGDGQATSTFAFDLKTCHLEKLEPGNHWDLPGHKSPNRTMSVSSGGVISLHHLDGASKDLASGFSYRLSHLAAPSGTGVPCLWLDNERILTQRANGRLVILTVGGAIDELPEIDAAPAEVFAPPVLRRDAQERVIYSCDSKEFLIDLQNRRLTPLTRHALGNEFELSVSKDQLDRQSVYYQGKMIGQWICNPDDVRTAPGLIALAFVRPSTNLRLFGPDGLAVWSNRNGEWKTVMCRVNSLIGWAD